MAVKLPELVASNKKSTIHVLHVDDDPTIQEITKLMLLDLDSSIEIENACSADDGLKKLSSKKYDIVVSDYEMPQKDGLQFLKELREAKNEISFILFTGKGREEVAIKALNLGADGYYNKQGSPETVYGELLHGIRRSFEHRKADELLRKSQEELKAIVNNAPLGIATSDSNMQFRSANEAFCRIIGYSEDELQKCSFRDITYPDDVEASNKDMKELICGNIHYFSKEKRYVRKDGNIIDGRVTVSAIRNSDNKPSLFVAELEDITQRKQAESELRETFNVLERVGEGIDAGLAVIGKDYRVVWANKRLMDLGVAPSKKCYETFNNLGAVCPDCGVEKIFKQNLPLDVHEYKTVNSKGETTWIELRATPFKDEEGNVTAALELAVPITDRKKAEEVVRISESHYRLLAENAQDVIWTGNLDGHFTYVSPSVLQLRGYTPEEVLKQSMLEALTPDSARIVSEAMQKSLETGAVPSNHFELEQPCKNGSTVWTEVSFSVVRDKTGNPQSILGVSRDITKRKCIETKLQQSEEQFRQLFSSMPSAVAVYEAVDGGADFLFLDFNKKAENIEKISKSSVVGKRVTEVFPGAKSFGIFSVFQRVWQSGKSEYYPEALYKDDKDQGTWRENWVYKLPNGNIVAIYNDITERKKAEDKLEETKKKYQLVFDNNFDGILVAKRNGTILSANAAICQMLGMAEQEVMKAGRQGIVVDEPRNEAALNVQDDNGQVVALLAFRRKDCSTFEAEISSKEFVDIDGSKSLLVTVRDVSNRLMLEDKLRTVSSFTRHDIGNKLLSAQGQLFLSIKMVNDQPEIKEHLEKIVTTLHDIGRILDVSKQYEAIGSQKLQFIDVGQAVNDALSLFGDLKGISFVNKVCGVSVLADQMLSTVFYNLIDNTVKYGEKTTKIEVSLQKNGDGSDSFVYRDDGVGISSKDKKRLFEKGFGKGSGYGLFLIKKTCEIYDWKINEEGEAGKGVKFVISIPVNLVKY